METISCRHYPVPLKAGAVCRLTGKDVECWGLVKNCTYPEARERHEPDELPESWMGAVIKGRPV